MRYFLTAILIALVIMILPRGAEANLGVGVGTAEIIPKEYLRREERIFLGRIAVFNSGDEPSQYNFFVTYNPSQEFEKPDASWFSFEPDILDIPPSSSKPVFVYITIPKEAQTGEYFAYLEARPKRDDLQVGIAAATKLKFNLAEQEEKGLFGMKAFDLKKVNPLFALPIPITLFGYVVWKRRSKSNNRIP